MSRTLLKLAALLLLTGAATTHAQVYNPDNLVGKAPPQSVQQHPKPAIDDMQWLWQFTRPEPLGRADDLRLDAHFQSMLAANFKQAQAMWGPNATHPSLQTVIPLFLSKYGAVTSEQNRYVAIDGCVPSFCAASGLLWIDLGRPQPLAVFVAVNWSTVGHEANDPKADYNMWLFPNHDLSPDELPLALAQSIAHRDARLAAAHRLVPHISQALIVEPDGSPYVLNPELTGANTIAPQPDTTTPSAPEEN
jgi:hypothetical protein